MNQHTKLINTLNNTLEKTNLNLQFYIDDKTLENHQESISWVAHQPEVLCVIGKCYQNNNLNWNMEGLIVTQTILNKNQLNKLFQFCNKPRWFIVKCVNAFEETYRRLYFGNPNLVFHNNVMPLFNNINPCVCCEDESFF